MKQVNSSNYFKHLEKVYKRTKDNRKPVNQLILGAPKGMKFETVAYLRGRHTRKCPWRFDEIPYMQYIGKSAGYHQFLSCGEINYIILCKEVLTDYQIKYNSLEAEVIRTRLKYVCSPDFTLTKRKAKKEWKKAVDNFEKFKKQIEQ